MGMIVLVVGVVLATAIVVATAKSPIKPIRSAGLVFAALVLVSGLVLSSTAYVGSDSVGVVYKHAMGPSLKEGRILAVKGEMGPQADILRPGWHFGYWPVIYTVKTVPLTEVKSGQVGIIETVDGLPMDGGQLFAPEWSRDEVQKMLDARYFLTDGKGRKGKQVTVLTPGRYPLNTELYKVKMVDQSEVLQGEVAVLKANFGTPASVVIRGENTPADDDSRMIRLAKEGEMGIRAEALPPGKYALNTDAYTVTEVWTTQMIAHFSARDGSFASSSPAAKPGTRQAGQHDPGMEEREITVTTSDGFRFPVDVRIEYLVEPAHAPILVAKLGDDEGERFRNAMNSAVRAIFRDNAGKVKALDYIQQRSIQEQQSLASLKEQMARFGVTVTAVRIGDVGNEETLGALLKTQKDRELAKQEQLTFQEQQKAAEQKKQLSKTTQESEEERRLATAAYAVKIADEARKQRVTEANAEAEAIRVKAIAQAEAYQKVAEQIGKSNAALIEVLKIVGERGIQITPRVMVSGAASRDGAAAALFGTMLDQMVSKDDETAKGSK